MGILVWKILCERLIAREMGQTAMNLQPNPMLVQGGVPLGGGIAPGVIKLNCDALFGVQGCSIDFVGRDVQGQVVVMGSIGPCVYLAY